MKLEIKDEAKLVATLYIKGYSVRQIGKRLLLSPSTVHRRMFYSGTKPRTSSEGVKLASDQGRLNAPRKNSHAIHRNNKGQYKVNSIKIVS